MCKDGGAGPWNCWADGGQSRSCPSGAPARACRLRCPPGCQSAVPTGSWLGKDLGIQGLEMPCLQGPCCQVLTTEESGVARARELQLARSCGQGWPSNQGFLVPLGSVTRIHVLRLGSEPAVKVHLEWRARGMCQGPGATAWVCILCFCFSPPLRCHCAHIWQRRLC